MDMMANTGVCSKETINFVTRVKAELNITYFTVEILNFGNFVTAIICENLAMQPE